MSSATLHFLCGRLASGKTTLARRIASEKNAVLFCEDEWLSKLSDGIVSFDDYLKWSRRCRSVMAPLIVNSLRCGTSVVLDFAGNTPKERAWVRSLFNEAGAMHQLHLLEADEEECLRRLMRRNVERPEGLHFADTSEVDFRAICKWFQPPSEEEAFSVTRYPM